MATEIKRVSYSYNSILEDQGVPSYFLDCLVLRDKDTVVDLHQSFQNREDFMQAITDVVPLLDPVPEPKSEWDDYGDHHQYYEVENL